ncbi:MAG TPA: MFS transporter [Propionibacteriaceae bacterium]|nr:MFS transporter [Propionibacteriaceae bacterium]
MAYGQAAPMISRVVAASALSNLGDGLRVVALPLLAAALTPDPLLVSGLVVAGYLPWVLFGLPIGSLVDRGRPEVFMLVTNIGRAVLLGLLTVGLASGATSIWLLYVVAFLLGIGEAAYDNASQSLVPRLVPDRRLESANAALVTAERVGQDLIGPAVAGVLFTVAVALPFGLNAVLVAVAAALLIGITSAAPRLTGRGGVLTETVAGMRWLWQDRFVRRLILTGACLVFTTSVWESTLVLLATGPVGLSAAGYGLVLGVGGLGGVAGAVATPYLVARLDRWRLQLGSLGLCGVVDLLLAVAPSPVTVALAWGGIGFGFAVWHVVSISTRQRVVPPEILARVNSAARTLSISALPAGALAGGIVADIAGLRAPAAIAAAMTLALLVVYAVTSRRDRSLLRAASAQIGR